MIKAKKSGQGMGLRQGTHGVDSGEVVDHPGIDGWVPQRLSPRYCHRSPRDGTFVGRTAGQRKGASRVSLRGLGWSSPFRFFHVRCAAPVGRPYGARRCILRTVTNCHFLHPPLPLGGGTI